MRAVIARIQMGSVVAEDLVELLCHPLVILFGENSACYARLVRDDDYGNELGVDPRDCVGRSRNQLHFFRP